jgi:hypothetical protein
MFLFCFPGFPFLFKIAFEAIRQLYTFCGITVVQCWYDAENAGTFAVVANEGGKVEVVDMISRQVVTYVRPFSDSVSSLKVLILE